MKIDRRAAITAAAAAGVLGIPAQESKGAGLYTRMLRSTKDNLNVHVTNAAVLLVGLGEFTPTQAIDAINSAQTAPLSVTELADLSAIQTQMLAEPTTLAKIVYYEKFKALSYVVEAEMISEAVWRSKLGIGTP